LGRRFVVAYPGLRYRRRQRAHGPVDTYQFVRAVPGHEDRRVTVEFDCRSWWAPAVYVDGPSGFDASPHRYPSRGRSELCIWHPDDPPDRTWVPEDGLLVLFGMIAEHLFKEAWWREHHEWLGEEYPTVSWPKTPPPPPAREADHEPKLGTDHHSHWPSRVHGIYHGTGHPGIGGGAHDQPVVEHVTRSQLGRAHRRHHLRGVPGRDARRCSERLDGSTPQPRRGTPRIRNTFAAAFEAYTSYKEFPYAIRRRRPDEPEGERIRLSEALRAVQEKVNYYLAWTQAESADVGEQYATLISEVRRIAGRAMHDAWNDPPRATDPEMNIPPELVDLSQLAAAEAEFMQAVRQHLSSLTPWWAR
jgi:hypothetical protein